MVVIVQCPHCSTRYRVDEERITRENPAFKCSRCKTVFLRHPDQRGHTVATRVPAARSANRQTEELKTGTLPFVRAAASGQAQQATGGPEDRERQEDAQKSDAAKASAAGAQNSTSEAATQDPVQPPPAGTNQAHLRPWVTRDWVESPSGALMQQRHSSFKAVCGTITAILISHFLLAFYLKSSYARAEGFFSAIPLVGKALVEERALACKITLRQVRGNYEIIKDRRRVFAISGEAVNNSATMIRDIQVEGTIINQSGKRWRKVIFCGNETRLTDLSTREIDLLHRLDPSYSLAPGESSRFVIVFTDPPPDLKEFTSRVVSVRPVPKGNAA